MMQAWFIAALGIVAGIALGVALEARRENRKAIADLREFVNKWDAFTSASYAAIVKHLGEGFNTEEGATISVHAFILDQADLAVRRASLLCKEHVSMAFNKHNGSCENHERRMNDNLTKALLAIGDLGAQVELLATEQRKQFVHVPAEPEKTIVVPAQPARWVLQAIEKKKGAAA